MKIELGYYRMRDGRKAKVICTDAPGIKPVVILVETLDGSDSYCDWVYADGKYHKNDTESSRDLIEPWREPVKYSVDIFIANTPKHDAESNSLFSYLFGRDARYWTKTKCDDLKKYRVTVEEVAE